MAGSSDFPLDPETGSVVDPDVLEARRARRAEQVEDDPVERGRRAERMVSALELRLAQAEGRLAAAERERAEVEGALARAENALTAARQREFSEQRRREEVESDAAGEVRALQEHVARLRAENERAAVRAAELSQALEGADADVRAARAAAAVERDRATAEVAGLQHELQRQGTVHAAVGSQVAELRAALDAVRSRAAAQEAEAGLEATRLRAAIVTLEGEQERSRARLERGRAELDALQQQLRAGAELVATREAELAAARIEAAEHQAARVAAEGAAAELRVQAAELERAVDEERLWRAALEALVREERGHHAEVRAGEDGRAAELEQLRAASEARLAALQATVGGLRAELTTAVTALERRAEAERAARVAAERELAAERDAVRALEATRTDEARAVLQDAEGIVARLAEAEAARAALAAEVAVGERTTAEVRAALATVQAELEDARRERRERTAREAAVEALVTDLVGTARALREGYEERLAALSAQGGTNPSGALGAQLADLERLRAELAREQQARAAAEASLAGEAAGRAALAAELDALRAAGSGNPIYDTLTAGPLVPGADHPALSRRGGEEGSGADAAPPAVVSDLARAMARLRSAHLAAPEGTGAVEEPAVAGDARSGADAPTPIAPTAAAPAPSPPVGGAPAAPATAAPPPAPGTPAPAAPVEPASSSAPAVHPALVEDVLPPPPPRGAAGLAPASVPPAPSPTARPWLGDAIAAFADVDAATAERLLLAALPAQALRIEKDVDYIVELPLTGRHRVHVPTGGRATVTPAGPDEPAGFVLGGAVGDLAPLAGGGVHKRLPGVVVRGRRWRLRRLLRALREPVGLPELQAAGAEPRSGDLLALLCSRVPSGVVRGTDFGVAYVVEEAGGHRSRTLVRAEPDGSLTAIPEAPELFAADATVRLPPGAFLPALTGATEPGVEGDAAAAATLRGWLLAAQG